MPHVSPLVPPAVQSTHAAPPVPHDGPDCAEYCSQVPLLVQHPPGHVFASQVQEPLVVSQSPLEHGEHVAPAVPHEPPACDPQSSHVPVAPPLQQPFAHDEPLQMQVPAFESPDVSHTRFVPHGAHVAPAVPQVAPSLAHGTQVPLGPPLQQPFGHDVASHTHWPVELHSVPDGHAAHATPELPQELMFSWAYASHVPLLQQPAHAVPPQLQLPLVHVEVAEQLPQLTPPVPHELIDWPE